MPTAADPLPLDPDDFDAIGILTEVVITLRAHAIEHDTDAAATIDAPEGWHRVVLTARKSGHVVLGVRYSELSTSRWHNVAGALGRRDWQTDEDGEGSIRTYPPGTEATTAAFEVLTAIGVGGAPRSPRRVTAVDGRGKPVALTL